MGGGGETGAVSSVSKYGGKVLCRLMLGIGVRSWMAALPTCRRYLLARGQCEGKLVIAAINQTWTEEKLSDCLELFCTEMEKCSCEVKAGLAGCWQRWSPWSGGGSPAPGCYCCGPHFQDDKTASSLEKEAPSSGGCPGEHCEKLRLPLALLPSSFRLEFWLCHFVLCALWQAMKREMTIVCDAY